LNSRRVLPDNPDMNDRIHGFHRRHRWVLRRRLMK
jgi:hypothetical protein